MGVKDRLASAASNLRDKADADKSGRVSPAEARAFAEAEVRATPLKALALSFACGFGSALLLVGIYWLAR